MTPLRPPPRHDRAALVGLVLAAIHLGCKPADEPMRRAPVAALTATRAGEIPGLDGGLPGLGPPPTSARNGPNGAAPIEVAAAGLNTPPVVGDVARDSADAGNTSTPRDSAGVADDDAGTPGAAEVDDSATAPDAAAVDEMAQADAGPIELGPGEGLVRGGEPLPQSLLDRLDEPVSQAAQEAARALNKSGLEKHRKKLYAEAIADYQTALADHPGHVFSRYNMACALALVGRTEEALGALEVLGHLAASQSSAADRLRAARLDSDFEPLRKDPRFRDLTGATDIIVAWTNEAERTEAKRLAELLRNARWLAKAPGRAWNAVERLPAYPAVLYRADDPVAARVAPEVMRALDRDDVRPDGQPGSPEPSREMRVEPAGPLPPEAPPIVVWLGGGSAPAPEPAPGEGTALPPKGGAPEATPEPANPGTNAASLRELKDFIGLRLHAAPSDGSQRLELKPTGFFSWVVSRASGESTRRTGRYQVRPGLLALTYKETVETKVAGEADPRIQVREGQSTTVPFSVPEPGVLELDGQRFRP